MDFTREPIIETIITPKEGCKLVVRSSKNTGQEEYFVDAVEVVSFGQASFFRSLERPKPFLVPVSDYELLEVREARMVLKSVGTDRSIKIGGGRESVSRVVRGNDKDNTVETPTAVKFEAPAVVSIETSIEANVEDRPPVEKKRDRRRQYRKRRSGQTTDKAEVTDFNEEKAENEEKIPVIESEAESVKAGPSSFASLLQPPPTLISETIGRYRENVLFKSAFFLDEEDQYKPHNKVQQLLEDDENEEFQDEFQKDESGIQTKNNLVEESSGKIELEDSPTYVEENIPEAPYEEFEKFYEPQDVIELPLTTASEEIKSDRQAEPSPEMPQESPQESCQDEEQIVVQEPCIIENNIEEKQDSKGFKEPEIYLSEVVLGDVSSRDEKKQNEEKNE